MRKYMLIAAGGFWGAILRFSIKSLDLSIQGSTFPINTFMINILGSFILGLFITAADDLLKLGEDEKIGVVSGFLGAFTSFSAISKEITLQLAAGKMLTVMLYVLLSIVLGLLSVYLGMRISGELVSRFGETEE